MRIGIDASNIRAGGGLTHLSEILHALDPQRHGIREIVVWGGRNTLEHLPERSWLRCVPVLALEGSLADRMIWSHRELEQSAKGCNVLFIPGGTYSGHFRPFVTLSQNMLPFDSIERRRYFPSTTYLRLLLLRVSQGHTFKRADGLIFLSEYARQNILLHIGEHNCMRVIPHGVNSRFHLPPREQRPISAYSVNNPFRLLYVSIVNTYKHQWIVAEAVARLRQQGFWVQLDMIGPAYKPSLRRLHSVLCRYDPENVFLHYHGSVAFQDLPHWYHKSDAFVFASSCENMPNILLEAMASGLPIASSNRGPMPEMLKDAGIYFNPENVEETTTTLRELLENLELRTQYSTTAFEYSHPYSWENCANNTFSFIVSVASQF